MRSTVRLTEGLGDYLWCQLRQTVRHLDVMQDLEDEGSIRNDANCLFIRRYATEGAFAFLGLRRKAASLE